VPVMPPPPPVTVEHTHPPPVPFHARTCPMLQLLIRLRFRLPVAPPPIRPLPLDVVTPVIVPPPLANTMSNSGGWLVVVLSLLSNKTPRPLLATSAMPSLGWLRSSHACTAEVTSTIT